MKYLVMLAVLLNVAGALHHYNAQVHQQATSIRNEWLTYRLYEDGSYRGTTLNGETVTGCLPDGLCQD